MEGSHFVDDDGIHRRLLPYRYLVVYKDPQNSISSSAAMENDRLQVPTVKGVDKLKRLAKYPSPTKPFGLEPQLLDQSALIEAADRLRAICGLPRVAPSAPQLAPIPGHQFFSDPPIEPAHYQEEGEVDRQYPSAGNSDNIANSRKASADGPTGVAPVPSQGGGVNVSASGAPAVPPDPCVVPVTFYRRGAPEGDAASAPSPAAASTVATSSHAAAASKNISQLPRGGHARSSETPSFASPAPSAAVAVSMPNAVPKLELGARRETSGTTAHTYATGW
eukprot:GHVU01049390.1.p1 GENE.GHVU01049390.1~~GHVU01049390.1.p1  ORF type:complete len:278 (+),score=26.75 GHVU01049390.1:233-1066(+)